MSWRTCFFPDEGFYWSKDTSASRRYHYIITEDTEVWTTWLEPELIDGNQQNKWNLHYSKRMVQFKQRNQEKYKSPKHSRDRKPCKLISLLCSSHRKLTSNGRLYHFILAKLLGDVVHPLLHPQINDLDILVRIEWKESKRTK